MKVLNLNISNCKQCPHFSRVTFRAEKPSCKYGKEHSLPKSPPFGDAKRDPYNGTLYYEATGEIPDWCPLPDAAHNAKVSGGGAFPPSA